MKKFWEYLKLVRLHNLLLVVGSVFLGGWLETKEFLDFHLILAAASALLLAAFGYAHNDFCDREIDRLNKNHRPLPRGRIEGKAVLILAGILAVSGVILTWWVNLYLFGLALLAVVLLVGYNLRWKKSFLLGNATVSFLSGGLFLYGAAAVKSLSLALVPAIFSFLFHFGREILKDLEDHPADQQVAARTLPIKMGTKKTLLVVTLIFLCLMVLVFLPYHLQLFNQRYLVLAALGVDGFLLYILWSLWKDHSLQNINRLNSLLKLNMYLGLAAILVGRW